MEDAQRSPAQAPVDEVKLAHRDLQHLLLNGRITLNGSALTAQELNSLFRAEQVLYQRAEILEMNKAAKLAEEKAAKKAKI